VTREVRKLLQECQARRKAEFDAHRRDVWFAVGDEVLLDTEHAPLPSRSLLSPRWMGGEPLPPSPAATPDGALEHEVQEPLLKFKMRYAGGRRRAPPPPCPTSWREAP
jgi:hypothetical protein